MCEVFCVFESGYDDVKKRDYSFQHIRREM